MRQRKRRSLLIYVSEKLFNAFKFYLRQKKQILSGFLPYLRLVSLICLSLTQLKIACTGLNLKKLANMTAKSLEWTTIQY